VISMMLIRTRALSPIQNPTISSGSVQ